MNLRTVVKVGNVSNLSDARYCAGFGVDMIGFNVNSEDEEHITVDTVKEIMGWVAGTEFILEYGSLSLSKIEMIHNQLSIDNYQVEDIDVANNIAKNGGLVYFKYIINDNEGLEELRPTIESLSSEINIAIIESHNDELTEAINDAISKINSPINFLKSYGISHETILDDISSNIFHGIALKGSQEDKPGFKDYDELADILEVLELD